MTLFRGVSISLLVSAAVVSASAQITMHDDRVFPESITSAPDGTVFIGSIGKGEVLRAEKGATNAEVWIKPGTAGLQQVAGVLADAASNTLWVCSMRLGGPGSPSALKAFDLKTAALKGSYEFPGGGLCNDIAVGRDGTAYATDTSGKRVLRLKKGAEALDVWASGDTLAGADGIAFGTEDTLYVNSVSSGAILRIPIAKDGSAGEIADVKTSQPLKAPDGMRALRANTFLLAEGGASQLDLVTIENGAAKVEVLKDGLPGITAVTQVGDTAWVNNSQMRAMRDPSTAAQPFTLQAVPIAAK
jgi:sugar lactone lactonase YvrE